MGNKLSDYEVVDVTCEPSLWMYGDPVRQELGVDFKSAVGRGVFGLRDFKGDYCAFMCYARTKNVPSSVSDLKEMTTVAGNIIVPYTVWSLQKGAGRQIINGVISLIKESGFANRVVTLSPLTEMARNFHLRNGAFEFRKNKDTVNFEYLI